jgi:prepilin-type N-terminal cleavage/methylation domain-containing protein
VKRGGFTLLEVLLAVLILGMGLSVFFGAANQGLSVVESARVYEAGRSYLNLLDLRAPLDLENLEEGELTGDLEDNGVPFRWTRTVTAVGKEEDKFFHLLTRVEWGDSDAPNSESTETYLHLPSALREDWVREPAEEE